jgi:hypothetical protein
VQTPQRDSVIRYIRRIAGLRTAGGLSDRQLLELFVSRRDEDAGRGSPLLAGVFLGLPGFARSPSTWRLCVLARDSN